MTWENVPALLLQICSVAIVGLGVFLTGRGIIRATAESAGALKQQVTGHDSRLRAVEHLVEGIGADRAALAAVKADVVSVQTDVKDLSKGQTTILVKLAELAPMLTGIKEQMQSQHDATKHSMGNLRSSVEAVARKIGMMPNADS